MKRFILLYLFYLFLFSILLESFFFVFKFSLEELITTFTVDATKVFIDFIGIQATLIGDAFYLDNAIMLVEPECNGLKALLLFETVILAYPASIRVKISWIIGSTIFLQFLNIVRVTFLAWVLESHADYFDFMHDFITPILLIAIALFMFYKYVIVANMSL